MRFIVYTAFTIAWMIMWCWTYLYHIKACEIDYYQDVGYNAQIVAAGRYPLSFHWSKPDPLLSPQFDAWRDSVIHTLDANALLKITGVEYRDESNTHDNALGLQRATAISELLGAQMPSDRIQIAAMYGNVPGDIRGKDFAGYRLSTVLWGPYVREYDAYRLIYFPYDSSAGDWDKAIFAAIFNLRSCRSAEGCISLAPLKPFQTTPQADKALLTWRLNALKRTIIEAGIDSSHVCIDTTSTTWSSKEIEPPLESQRNDWIAIECVK